MIPNIVEKLKKSNCRKQANKLINIKKTYQQIEETLMISTPSVHKILNEYLKIGKCLYTLDLLSAHWGANSIYSDLMQKMLKNYENEAQQYLNNFLTKPVCIITMSKQQCNNYVWLLKNEKT